MEIPEWIDASHGEKSKAAGSLKSALPVFEWLRGYQKDWLRPDVIAGLTAAAVVIPIAMAYATIAGLPVQVGLYTAFLPMIIYAVRGRPGRSASAQPRPSPFSLPFNSAQSFPRATQHPC